jgi:hypothetical protein
LRSLALAAPLLVSCALTESFDEFDTTLPPTAEDGATSDAGAEAMVGPVDAAGDAAAMGDAAVTGDAGDAASGLLIQDGFEDGTCGLWQNDEATLMAVPVAHSGTWGCQVCSQAAVGSVGDGSRRLVYDAGPGTFVLQFYARPADGGMTNTNGAIRVFHDGGSDDTNSTAVNPTDWTLIQVTAVPNYASTGVRAALQVGIPGSCVTFDDVSLAYHPQ